MSRLKIAAMLAIALSAVSCSNSTSPSTTTTTAQQTVTDTFTGTLTRNGGTSFAFSVNAAGAVYATITAVTDSVTAAADTTTLVGLSLGTWTGSACTIVLSNDQALKGTTVTGAVSGTGTLCARVYDVGKVVNPLDYQITVVHP
jgi:hypothetical protein